MGNYMKYLMIAMAIADKASDGKLTRDEVIDCVKDAAPEKVEIIISGLQDALADGHITAREAFRVLANSHLLD